MKLACPVCASENVTFVPRQKAEWKDSMSCQSCGYVGMLSESPPELPPIPPAIPVPKKIFSSNSPQPPKNQPATSVLTTPTTLTDRLNSWLGVAPPSESPPTPPTLPTRPNVGQKADKAPSKIVVVGSAIIACFVALGLLFKFFDPDKTPLVETAMQINAWQLAADYSANEIAADNKYKGHLVQVQGQIDKIGKDILDHPYVVLGGSEMFRSVQCMLTPAAASKAANLQIGEAVSLTGKVNGLMMNVLLIDCDFTP